MPNVSELSGLWWAAAFGTAALVALVTASVISMQIEKQRARELEAAKTFYLDSCEQTEFVRAGNFYEPTAHEVDVLIEKCERQMMMER